MRSRRNGSPCEGCRGSTFVEFALVFPLLIVLTLALIDFSRCISVRATLDSAANRAVSLASVIQDLDTDCRYVPPADQSTCGTKRQIAIQAVLNEARRLPTSTNISATSANSPLFLLEGTDTTPAIELRLDDTTMRGYYTRGDSQQAVLTFDPKLPAGPSLQEVLQRIPLEVTVRAGIRPYLWMLSEFTIAGHAVGYRERRNVPAFPARLDCQATEVPAGGTTTNSCPCASDPLDPAKISIDGSPCTCRAGLVYQEGPDGTFHCNCPTGTFLQVDGKGSCTQCPYVSGVDAGCAITQFFDTAKCQCLACSGFMLQTANGNACACPADFATDNPCSGAKQIYNLAKCTCNTCPGSGTANANHSACECSLECDPIKNQYLDAPNCVCRTCNAPKTLAGKLCVCSLTCPAGQVLNSSTCTCTACDPPYYIDKGTCVCSNSIAKCASSGMAFDAKSCTCVACTPPKVPTAGACKCPTVPCYGGTVDVNSCSCTCPADRPLLIGGQFCGPKICAEELCVTGAGGAFRPE